MADITPDRIVCRFDGRADQWVAHFEHRPQVAFGADIPGTAYRQLLEGTEVAPDSYPLVCDADRAGTGIVTALLIWQPPEILFPCPTCGGTGQYIGLADVDVCKACRGRRVVSV